MARSDDSSGNGGTVAALRKALGLMHGSAAQLYDIAEGLDGERQEAIEVIAADLDSGQSGIRHKHLAQLTIPGDYIEAFRQGLLRELKFNGDWLAEQAAEANQALAALENPGWHHPSDRPRADFGPFECIGGPLQYCGATAEYLREVEDAPEGDVTLNGDPGNLKHAVEAVGHDRAAKHLSDVEFGGRRPSRPRRSSSGRRPRPSASSERPRAERRPSARRWLPDGAQADR